MLAKHVNPTFPTDFLYSQYIVVSVPFAWLLVPLAALLMAIFLPILIVLLKFPPIYSALQLVGPHRGVAGAGRLGAWTHGIAQRRRLLGSRGALLPRSRGCLCTVARLPRPAPRPRSRSLPPAARTTTRSAASSTSPRATLVRRSIGIYHGH